MNAFKHYPTACLSDSRDPLCTKGTVSSAVKHEFRRGGGQNVDKVRKEQDVMVTWCQGGEDGALMVCASPRYDW